MEIIKLFKQLKPGETLKINTAGCENALVIGYSCAQCYSASYENSATSVFSGIFTLTEVEAQCASLHWTDCDWEICKTMAELNKEIKILKTALELAVKDVFDAFPPIFGLQHSCFKYFGLASWYDNYIQDAAKYCEKKN